jgi:predicted AAA+ superfamily ATPase
MRSRGFWQARIEAAWKRRRVVWLAGVRRAGKTVLCQSLDGIEYFDCELPRVRQGMEDPEGFLDGLRGKRVVLDEIHRLGNPSQLLKIAADHYRDVRIVATGSSSLGASAKFRDTLTGRKEEVWLTPMIEADLTDFGNADVRHRLLHGGLPPFFLADRVPERDFQEWVDAYWAKDIQELFRLERRHSFQRFLELLLVSSGGIFEATRYAGECEVSRTTIVNYLAALEATFVVHVLRPFARRRTAEIVSAPKVYAFDTGFVCYYRGWHNLRDDDTGPLWEHFVLNELHAHLQRRDVRYWRDKRGHEIDFVLAGRGAAPAAVECKWRAGAFDPSALLAFRRGYPKGLNFVVANDVRQPWKRRYDGIEVRFISLAGLVATLGP